MKRKITTLLLALALCASLAVPVWAGDSEKAPELATAGAYKTIATDFNTGYAIKNDGTLWAWGGNANDSPLGDGTNEYRNEPVKILDNVVSVHTSDWNAFAVKNDGTLWAWGSNNSYWPLGDGTSITRLAPVKIMDDVAAVCAEIEASTVFAIKRDGTLWGWGDNSTYMLGIGTTENHLAPVKILENVKSVGLDADGDYYSTFVYAVKNDDTLWRWGMAEFGETTSAVKTPVQVSEGAEEIIAGLLADERLGADGVFKRGDYYNDISDVAAYADSGYGDWLWLKNDGTLWFDGRNGGLGYGTTPGGDYGALPGTGQILSDVRLPDTDIAGSDITGNFTDENFLAAVYAAIGKTAPDPIYDTDVAGITSLDVSESNIASLTGIEHFISLQYLNCEDNRLTGLNLSGLSALEYVFCGGNQLTELDVSGLTALKTLDCPGNQLTGLDLSGLSALEDVSCGGNQLIELNLSGLTALEYLYCHNNRLTGLNLSGLTALIEFACSGNRLTELNLSGLTALWWLQCEENRLTGLDVSGLTALEYIYCYGNNMSSEDDVTGRESTNLEAGDFIFDPQNDISAGIAPTITTVSLPAGTVGTAYSQALAAAGTTPVTWSVDSGALPDGLSLNPSTGTISGTPTTAGAANFTVKASNGVSPDDIWPLSIAVNAESGNTDDDNTGNDPSNGGGASAGGGGGGGGGGASAPAVQTAPAAGGAVSLAYTLSSGTATLTLPDNKVTELVEKSSGTASIDLSEATGATSAVLPKTALGKLADAGKAVEIILPQGIITLEPEAAASVAEQAGGANVSVAVKTVAAASLNAAQQAAVKSGDTVVDISILSGTQNITAFDGLLTAAVPYSGQLPAGAWYLNGAGELEKLESTYDAATKTLSFKLSHLSFYVVGYDEEAEENANADAWSNLFTDVKSGDWFYGDVEYAVTNGLFAGTSTTAFSPNTAMTRGMLVTVLGRLHGVDTSGYTASGFDDVAAQYYAPYIEWAKESGIVSGVGGNLFAPDAAIARQDLAAIIIRYAEFADRQFPVTLQYVTFADETDIADYAKNAAQTLYGGGIVSGKPGNLFDPKAGATRAEVAAILHRFAERI